MSFDINKLKSLSRGTLSLIKDSAQKSYNADDRFWKPTRDKAGNATAIIRILPSIREGKQPWAERWTYFVRGTGGIYSEVSLRTVGKSDPMAEYIATCWNSAETEEDKNKLRTAGLNKAHHEFISNILVIKDLANPENDGKVMLYKYGQKIYDMILDKAKDPLFEGDVGNINVTDWEEGCNFRLVVYTKDNRFPNYDKSTFDNPSPVGDEKRILELANQMYDLSEFDGPDSVKSREDLESRMKRVFGSKVSNITPNTQTYNTTEVSAPSTNAVSPKSDDELTPWETDENYFDNMLKDI